MKLSILICSIPSRYNQLHELLKILNPQCKKKDVELLILTDNRKRTIGEKRNELMQLAKGEYIVYVDDDDTVTTDFVRELLLATMKGDDCIVFKEEKTIGDYKKVIVDYSIEYKEITKTDTHIYKRPNSRMCIKKELVKDIPFQHINANEDEFWGIDIASRLKTETKIDKVLYFYKATFLTSASRGFKSLKP